MHTTSKYSYWSVVFISRLLEQRREKKWTHICTFSSFFLRPRGISTEKLFLKNGISVTDYTWGSGRGAGGVEGWEMKLKY